jgi:peroxiredoxin
MIMPENEQTIVVAFSSIKKAGGGATMTVQNGDPLPKAHFTVMTQDGPEARTTDQIFQGRKVVLFGVPGAFTPLCDKQHLPGFLANTDEFRRVESTPSP